MVGPAEVEETEVVIHQLIAHADSTCAPNTFGNDTHNYSELKIYSHKILRGFMNVQKSKEARSVNSWAVCHKGENSAESLKMVHCVNDL